MRLLSDPTSPTSPVHTSRPLDLLKFLEGRRTRAFPAWLLSKVKIVVDCFHWPNHKDENFCAKHVNPKKCAELGPTTNTEACEEVSSRLLDHLRFSSLLARI